MRKRSLGRRATEAVADRPTETVTGLAGGALAYGWLAERGCPNGIAVAVGAVIAFAPTLISNVVDAIRR